jgi:hypothetical protein
MRECSTALAIMEVQIKRTLRFHLPLVRMTNKKPNNKCWQGIGEEERKRTLSTVDGNVN